MGIVDYVIDVVVLCDDDDFFVGVEIFVIFIRFYEYLMG